MLCYTLGKTEGKKGTHFRYVEGETDKKVAHALQWRFLKTRRRHESPIDECAAKNPIKPSNNQTLSFFVLVTLPIHLLFVQTTPCFQAINPPLPRCTHTAHAVRIGVVDRVSTPALLQLVQSNPPSFLRPHMLKFSAMEYSETHQGKQPNASNLSGFEFPQSLALTGFSRAILTILTFLGPDSH